MLDAIEKDKIYLYKERVTVVTKITKGKTGVMIHFRFTNTGTECSISMEEFARDAEEYRPEKDGTNYADPTKGIVTGPAIKNQVI